jgi:uncharacterized protein
MRHIQYFLFVLFCIASNALAQDIPTRPEPMRLVNDFVGIFSPQESSALEQKLVAFNDSTSTQVAVVVLPDLKGYDKSEVAFAIGEKWGVGQKGKNNGVVILIKPKTVDSRGEAFIATGYGLEGALPDAICKRIVETEMIPLFKQNNYYGGVDAAVNTIISLTKGEYTADQYMKKTQKKENNTSAGIVIFVLFIIFIFGLMSGSRSNRNHHSMGSGSIPFWMLMAGLGSSRGSGSGSWGNFSSGGGGFGGFGGGSFGGGGAGGSW